MSTVRGPDVITAWGVGNALLVGILIGYGERWIPIALYAGSVALIELIGVVFWLIYLRQPSWANRTFAPRRSRPAFLIAVVAGFAGAGLVYQGWMAIPAAFPAIALVGELGGWAERRQS